MTNDKTAEAAAPAVKWVCITNDHGYGIGPTRAIAARRAKSHSAGWVKPAALQLNAACMPESADIRISGMGDLQSDAKPLEMWERDGGGKWKRMPLDS